MRWLDRIRKDHISAALLLAIGAGVLGLGMTYDIGDLHHMGPGIFPVSLGTMMILVAVAIGVTAPSAVERASGGAARQDGGPQWRGWLCIVAGVALFVIAGEYGGLVPATLLAVFASAMGDRDDTWKSAAVLAAVVTLFGVAIFHFGLSLQLPLFQWGDMHQTLMDLWYGFGIALTPNNFMWSVFGVLIGNLIGVLPGMGALTTISMLLPLTYVISPVPAILMLAGIFYSSQYGGAIGAILLNLPSHPPHAVTCLDGYPMTLQGRGGAEHTRR